MTVFSVLQRRALSSSLDSGQPPSIDQVDALIDSQVKHLLEADPSLKEDELREDVRTALMHQLRLVFGASWNPGDVVLLPAAAPVSASEGTGASQPPSADQVHALIDSQVTQLMAADPSLKEDELREDVRTAVMQQLRQSFGASWNIGDVVLLPEAAISASSVPLAEMAEEEDHPASTDEADLDAVQGDVNEHAVSSACPAEDLPPNSTTVESPQ